MKKIKASNRGLTFSFDETKDFYPGSHYSYFVADNRIIIKANKEGKLKVSKKKVGTKIRSLFDIRKKAVVEKIRKADFMEVSFEGDQIIVYLRKISTDSIKKDNVYAIEDVLQSNVYAAYHIPTTLLAAGGEYQQLTLSDWFSSHTECASQFDETVKKQIGNVFDVVSLFSGAGMLDYPFHLDDAFNITFACDYDKSATESYKANIGNHVICDSVQNVHGLKKTDVVIGGPSCKAFSNANRSTTRLLNHPDYALVKEYTRIVKETNPSAFVIENVPAFVTANEGELLKEVMQELSDYETSVNIVCDADVGGYTNRKRVFIIGSRIGLIKLPNLKISPRKTVREALSKVDSSWFNFHDVTKSKPETEYRMSLVPNGCNWQALPEHLRSKSKHSSYFRRLDPDNISPTLTNFRKTVLMPPKESENPNRILTVAEASALSGFPKEFKFLGSLADRQQQVGNGVTFALANLVKNTVKKALLKAKGILLPV